MSETIDFTPLTAADREPIARLLHRARCDCTPPSRDRRRCGL
jgi:hypothetical protein